MIDWQWINLQKIRYLGGLSGSPPVQIMHHCSRVPVHDTKDQHVAGAHHWKTILKHWLRAPSRHLIFSSDKPNPFSSPTFELSHHMNQPCPDLKLVNKKITVIKRQYLKNHCQLDPSWLVIAITNNARWIVLHLEKIDSLVLSIPVDNADHWENLHWHVHDKNHSEVESWLDHNGMRIRNVSIQGRAWYQDLVPGLGTNMYQFVFFMFFLVLGMHLWFTGTAVLPAWSGSWTWFNCTWIGSAIFAARCDCVIKI